MPKESRRSLVGPIRGLAEGVVTRCVGTTCAFLPNSCICELWLNKKHHEIIRLHVSRLKQDFFCTSGIANC